MGNLTNDLALERTGMAVARTLQSWIRAARSMISFGFSIGKLGQSIDETEVRGILHSRPVSLDSLAFFLVAQGNLALLVAADQYQFTMRRPVARGLPLAPSLAVLVSGALVLGGVSAFAALGFKL